MPRTDAVLFDLDGTLCVHEQDGDALLQQTFQRVGIDPYTDQTGLREAIYDAPDADSEVAFLANAFGLAAERAGAGAVPATDVAEAYMDLVDHTAVRFREGARQALAHVADSPVGLVTNGSRENQRQKLESLDIEDAFDAIAYAGDDLPAKPATEPFESVLGDLDVDADATVHVGNSLGSDVVGANEAGLRSVWVPTAVDYEENATVEPVHTLDSLENLPTVL